VITPLVYLFAGAAGLLLLLFAASALLIYRHARTRRRRGRDLYEYLASPPPEPVGRNFESLRVVADAHKKRAKVMHLTIGDLLRDENLAAVATEGVLASSTPPVAGEDPGAA
jgi:hypothetical protein